MYRPPLRGAPKRRVGGGVRGVVGGAPVELFVLAPDHTGWTIHPQTDLYWYFASPSMSTDEYSMRLDITFNDEEVIKPILELSLDPPETQGVQRIRLSDHGIQLKPGATYEWFVALVRDPHNRSLDIIAGAAIMRVDPSKALLERLAKASEREKPSIYAQEGLWYDALSSISDLIEAHPDDKDVREQRALLLEQVGLSKAAADDR